MARAAEIGSNTVPSSLPQRNDRTRGAIFGVNVEALFGPGEFEMSGHRTGSTDMGDSSHALPAIHPIFRIADPVAGH